MDDNQSDEHRGSDKRRLAIEALQQAVNEGLSSGAAVPFDLLAFKLTMRSKYPETVAKG